MHFERKCVDIDSICLRYKELIQMLYNIGIEFSEALMRAVIFFLTKEKIEVAFKEIKDKKFNESMFIQRNLRH